MIPEYEISGICISFYNSTLTTVISVLSLFYFSQVTKVGIDPLYNDIHYNRKILSNVILIDTEWIYCSQSAFFITTNSV